MIVHPRHRLVAVALVAALGLASACGGDDSGATSATETSSASTTSEAGEEAGTAPAPSGGPDATIAPATPDELLPAVGPVEVDGDPLPVLVNTDGSDDPAVGTPAPVVVGVGLDGSTVRIDAEQDGPTMVVVLAHWCPHCNAEVPRLNELRDAGRFPDDLNIVAVSTSPDPSGPHFPPVEWLRDEMDWTYPAILDGPDFERQTWIAADAYGVSSFPFVTLIDAAGDVAARWSGEREPDDVIAAIDAALS